MIKLLSIIFITLLSFNSYAKDEVVSYYHYEPSAFAVVVCMGLIFFGIKFAYHSMYLLSFYSLSERKKNDISVWTSFGVFFISSFSFFHGIYLLVSFL